jgi:hypothetical protein
MDASNYVKEGLAEDWSELASKETFLRLIQQLQRGYHIESRIKEEFHIQMASLDKRPTLREGTFETLRKDTLL